MHVNQNAELPRASLPGIEHTTLAGGDEGLKSLSVWRQTVAAGAATPPHRHDCEEVIVVTRGSGEVRYADRVVRFGPDSTVVIPRNVDHQVFNTGTEPMEIVAAFSMSPVAVVFPDGQPLELPWRT
jgi:mannose-6-phosphate isomerase-like protein (cupin superfamily)